MKKKLTISLVSFSVIFLWNYLQSDGLISGFGTAVDKHKDGRAYFLVLSPNGEDTFEVKTSPGIWESIIIGERYGYTIKYNMFKENLVEISKAYSD
ncbi:MAG: hypothetical protein ACK4M9_21135 [Anaerobacillus sp.]|uniref:hypothetical protein n=1 Tax=Anaerobacillus sp. TaxID=1872506 RepID=UPI00391B22B9